MGIVDDKGRLFKKINAFDFIVLFFLVVLLCPILYFGTKLYSGQQIHYKKSKINRYVLVTLRCRNLMPEIINFIKVNDKQIVVTELGSKRVTLRKIVSIAPSELIALQQQTLQWNVVPHPVLKDIIIEISMSCNQNFGGLFFAGTPIKVGLSYTFQSQWYSIEGVIIDIKLLG